MLDHCGGIQDDQCSAVATEVIRIQSKDMLIAMRDHCRHIPGVMGILPRNLFLQNQTSPTLVNRGRIRPICGERFEGAQMCSRFLGREAQSVPLARSSGDHPKFPFGLGKSNQLLAQAQAAIDGLSDYGMLGSIALSQAAEYVRV